MYRGVDVSILYGTWYPPAIEGCIHLLGEAVSTKWYCMQVCILIVFELVSTNYWYESWYQPYIGVVHLLYWFLKCAANYVDFWYVAILLAYTIFLKIVICCPFFLPNYGHQNLPDATTGRPIIFWLQKCPNWSNFFFWLNKHQKMLEFGVFMGVCKCKFSYKGWFMICIT